MKRSLWIACVIGGLNFCGVVIAQTSPVKPPVNAAPVHAPPLYAPRPAAPVETARNPPPPSKPQTPVPVTSPAGSTALNPNDRAAACILIKNTLVAVNQGNLTGNFTVLRDLSSPGFRARNSAGDLATIFQTIRQKKVDLSPVVTLEPVIAPPRVTKEGLLMLEGYFASQPLRINFQLAYLKDANGGWMIDAVSVGVAPANGTSNATAANVPSGDPQRPVTR